MPTYGYECVSCDNQFEIFQSIKDDALTTCETCGGKLRKRIYPVGISFKGSGFYVNDYAPKPSGGSESSSPASASEGMRAHVGRRGEIGNQDRGQDGSQVRAGKNRAEVRTEDTCGSGFLILPPASRPACLRGAERPGPVRPFLHLRPQRQPADPERQRQPGAVLRLRPARQADGGGGSGESESYDANGNLQRRRWMGRRRTSPGTTRTG